MAIKTPRAFLNVKNTRLVKQERLKSGRGQPSG